MDFEPSERVRNLDARLSDFMDAHVWPSDSAWTHSVEAGQYPMELIDGLKAKARDLGLWNLFLPGLKDDEPGTRLSNVEYAPLAETMGRLPWASEIFNCNAPDTGNMEILHLFGTESQRKRWLEPLMTGEIRSAVAITEPDCASSDPTNLSTTIRPDGDSYVVNGRKWFTTGACHPNFAFTLAFGLTDIDLDRPRHRRHSFVIVPANARGFRVVRNIPIMNHLAPEGHCEIEFDNVVVPRDNLLGEEGAGFAVAQARLGPGRVHHCMRTIGQCERALELMCERALSRSTFGNRLADYANIQDWIARSRIEIDQARLLCLYASWLMDRDGNKAARVLVSQIKVAAANLQIRVLDRAIQVWGAAGLSNDTPLAGLWTWGRALRFLDGPDEVHLRLIARNELRSVESRQGNS